MTAEIRDWNGGAFDPSNLRVFSILPDCDADEGYCVRHDREMERIAPVVHHAGGLYTTADGWAVYSCPLCRREIGPGARELYRRHLGYAFHRWDDTETDVLAGAFRFLREGKPEDVTADEWEVTVDG